VTIYEIYREVIYRLNRTQRGNAFSIDEFNNTLEVLDMDMLKLKFGIPEEYQNRYKMPRQAWEVSHKITEDLGHLKVRMGKDTPPLYINTLGIATFPKDYLHLSTVYTNHGDIEVLNDDDFSGRIHTKLKKPTIKNPICRIIDKGAEFEPRNLVSANFTYIRMPNTAFLDYTIVNDDIVYLDENGSHDGSVLTVGTPSRTVQLDWPRQTHSDIISVLVNYASQNLRDGTSYQTSERRKTKGI